MVGDVHGLEPNLHALGGHADDHQRAAAAQERGAQLDRRQRCPRRRRRSPRRARRSAAGRRRARRLAAGLIAWSAPKARRRRASGPTGRCAMLVRAPHRAAPCTQLRPTPPVPIVATWLPGRTAAVLMTAPRPVMHAAGQQRMRSVSGTAARDRHDLRCVDDARARQRRRCAGPGGSALPSAAVKRRALVERRSCVSHKGGSPRGAGVAGAARADEGDDDVIARRDPATPGPTSSTTPAASCPNTAGRRPAPGAVHRQDVAVADGAGGDLDADLAAAGPGKADLLDDERLPRLPADGRPHGPRSAAWIALCGGAGVGLRSSAPRSSVARHLRPAPGR